MPSTKNVAGSASERSSSRIAGSATVTDGCSPTAAGGVTSRSRSAASPRLSNVSSNARPSTHGMFAKRTLVRSLQSARMAEAPETERTADGERQQSLQSLERGMAVIQVFSRERPSLNLSELALPLMEQLVEETHESCSAATLDLPDVVYVARVPTRRIMSITLSVGTRLPAHCTSMGRVLLAALPPEQLDAYLAETELEQWTARTITDPDRLRAALDDVRQRGWALVDQELEIGLRSVAAPIRRGRDTIAAMNVSSAVSRVSLDDLRRRILPPLVRTADTISNALTQQGPVYHRPLS